MDGITVKTVLSFFSSVPLDVLQSRTDYSIKKISDCTNDEKHYQIVLNEYNLGIERSYSIQGGVDGLVVKGISRDLEDPLKYWTVKWKVFFNYTPSVQLSAPEPTKEDLAEDVETEDPIPVQMQCSTPVQMEVEDSAKIEVEEFTPVAKEERFEDYPVAPMYQEMVEPREEYMDPIDSDEEWNTRLDEDRGQGSGMWGPVLVPDRYEDEEPFDEPARSPTREEERIIWLGEDFPAYDPRDFE